MKLLRYITLGIICILFAAPIGAQDDSHSKAVIVRKDSVDYSKPIYNEFVRVGEDTVPVVIPQKNYGRFDRGLLNYLYIPKGKWSFGMTASYGELNTEDVQLLSMLNDIDFKGKIYSLKPSVSYFFDHNQSVGLRINYTRGLADLGSLALDLGEDMSFALKDISYYYQNYSMGLVYRNYVGLSQAKRFGVFNEISLDFGSGSSRFKRSYADELYDTRTLSTSASLNFSPGVCVFFHDYVAFNISFGVFGLKLNKEKQMTNDTDEGTRFSSGANFRFNIFNINFGLLVVI